jgi:hypothetical protein
MIRESDPFGEPGRRNNSGDSIFDLELNRFGTRKYRFLLEVQIPGRDPYEVDGEFKVPRKAENTGWLAADVGNALKPGLELPVRVNSEDGQAVWIDWDKFLAAPGRKKAQKAANQSGHNARVKAELEKNPKLAAQFRTQNAAAVGAWAAAVRGGSLTREEFEETVTLEVECGRMDPADAEAARATLD